jgi:hypothetical protein
MMLPARTASPPNFFTPKRLPALSLPFFERPPPCLAAHLRCTTSPLDQLHDANAPICCVASNTDDVDLSNIDFFLSFSFSIQINLKIKVGA